MKYFIGMALMFIMQSSFAEVYQCKVGSNFVFQDKPCAGSKELKEKVKAARDQEQAKKYAAAKYEAEMAAKVDPKIGMTRKQVENSTWGYPNDVNKTTTARGIREQWVYRQSNYKSQYLYFENGVLTSMQD